MRGRSEVGLRDPLDGAGDEPDHPDGEDREPRAVLGDRVGDKHVDDGQQCRDRDDRGEVSPVGVGNRAHRPVRWFRSHGVLSF